MHQLIHKVGIVEICVPIFSLLNLYLLLDSISEFSTVNLKDNYLNEFNYWVKKPNFVTAVLSIMIWVTLNHNYQNQNRVYKHSKQKQHFDSAILAESSQRLIAITSRHKKQIENLTKETVSFVFSLLKMSYFSFFMW